jgi:YD repeat-containing protein
MCSTRQKICLMAGLILLLGGRSALAQEVCYAYDGLGRLIAAMDSQGSDSGHGGVPPGDTGHASSRGEAEVAGAFMPVAAPHNHRQDAYTAAAFPLPSKGLSS